MPDDNPFAKSRASLPAGHDGDAPEAPATGGTQADGDFPPGLGRLIVWAVLGSLLTIIAWLLPVHWKSLAPSVVEHAGQGTATLTSLGLLHASTERPGPASLVLAAAQSVRDPQAPKLSAAIDNLRAWKPELTVWGGRDRLIESIFGARRVPARGTNTPILQVLMEEQSRAQLRQHLLASASPGVRAIMMTRDFTNTTQFVPATRPGGQPFEAAILLAALLYESERLPSALAQQMAGIAQHAGTAGLTSGWEGLCLDLLALGNRLDWMQLIELLRLVPHVHVLTDLAQLARKDAARFAQVYSACLIAQSASGVTAYLGRHPQRGAEDLAQALAAGEGAVKLLLNRQLSIHSPTGPLLSFTAPWVLRSLEIALALKALGFLLAALCFFVVWNELSAVEPVEGLADLSPRLRWRRWGVTLLLFALLAASSEPLLLRTNRARETARRLNWPVLVNAATVKFDNSKTRNRIMNLDTSTIVSVAFFAALQVVVYAICLLKIREINQQRCSPLLKLRLMENEENLFDGGLYVGIAGTATALVLQVLGLIEANLLAAYSSNLFGILCVALVKIRHVRSFKKQLILQSQAETNPVTAVQPVA
jgi:hypothetical protein